MTLPLCEYVCVYIYIYIYMGGVYATTETQKILTENTISEQQNNKQKLQVLEALYIRNIQPELNRINFETSANVLKSL